MEKIITEIEQGMLNFLNNNEMEQLHKILINTLKDFTFIKDDKKTNLI